MSVVRGLRLESRSIPERSEFTLFLGCETLPMSFALSELPPASPISETGRQKQKNGCYGERLVAMINWQYLAFSSCIVKVGCPPERSTWGHFCNNVVVTYSILLGSHNNTDETWSRITSFLNMRKIKILCGVNPHYLRSHTQLGTDRTTTNHHQLCALSLTHLPSTSLRRDDQRSELLVLLEGRLYVH